MKAASKATGQSFQSDGYLELRANRRSQIYLLSGGNTIVNDIGKPTSKLIGETDTMPQNHRTFNPTDGGDSYGFLLEPARALSFIRCSFANTKQQRPHSEPNFLLRRRRKL